MARDIRQGTRTYGMTTLNLEEHGLIEVPRHFPVPGGPQDVSEALAQASLAVPSREALVTSTRRFTYRELDLAANRAARAWMELGVRTGDRVACCLPNEADIIIAFLGAMRLGAMWVGVNRALAPREKQMIAADCAPRVTLVEDGHEGDFRLENGATPWAILGGGRTGAGPWVELVERVSSEPLNIEIDPHAPAAIAYTSGTTGTPKGAVHTQHNLVLVGIGQRALGRLREGMRMGAMMQLTLLNLQTLYSVTASITHGTIVVLDRMDPATIARGVEQERIEYTTTVPTVIHDLLSDPSVTARQLQSLHTIAVGGAAPSDEFRTLFLERFGFEPLHSYGLTEAPTGCISEIPREPHVPGSSGRPYPTLRAVIVDSDDQILAPGEEGELCIGPTLDGPYAGVYTPMLGYWNRPEETKRALRNGMLHTGDIARIDERGNVFIIGRRSEVILRGGANIYPAEVEEALTAHPAVARCGVVGVPDLRLGERVIAFVEVFKGSQVDESALLDHCAARIARYKTPAEVVFVDDIPVNVGGKVVKRGLRELYERPAE
jgi:long-chain acyl-CoA synthetase